MCGYVLVVGPLSAMNRSIPTQQPWVALGSPATQEFYALVRNHGVKRVVRLKVESLRTSGLGSTRTVQDYEY